jgi:hypothetical protein
MPEGGVHVAALLKACEVTSISFAAVVVMLGAACVRLLAVVWPSSTSTGVVLSTPENVWMPPTAPVLVLIVHV